MAIRWVGRWRRGLIHQALPALILPILLAAPAVQAQSSLVERLRMQRVKVRAAEVIASMGTEAEPRRAVDIEWEPSDATHLLFWWLPPSKTPHVALPPLHPVPPPPPEVEAPPPALDEIRWDRVASTEQADFLNRFREALWTVEGMTAFSPIDTTATPELRGRLFGAFGPPTRTAVARGVEGFEGSTHVQFEYWFVVNDSIPFVALDVDGPFGNGLVLAGDFAHTDVLGQVKRDLAKRLVRTSPMPYVDYYRSRERNQWYRAGYDGADYYVKEIRRPRWARRRSETGKWYLFR